MAGIDKIYGTYKERDKLLKWLKIHEKPIECTMGTDGKSDIKKFCYPSEFVSDVAWWEGESAISNFPPEIDQWLWENCPLHFIRKRLNEQYNENPTKAKLDH